MKRLPLFLVSAAALAFASACTKSDMTPSSSTTTTTTTTCTISVSSVASAVTAVGVTGTITVTAGTGCSWTATPSASFITVAPGTGSGNGTFTYTVAANTGAVRSGSIQVGSNIINFTQESPKAPTTCTIALSTSSASLGSSAGSTSVNVTSGNSACAWTAVSNSSFLTVSSGASGSGSGAVTVAATANTTSARTGTVTIGGLTFTVTQAGSGLIASFVMTDPNQTIGSTTECRFRSTASSTTCTLTSTSFATKGIVQYDWTVQYTYVTVKTLTGSSTFPSFSFTDTCGQTGSTDDGVAQPLSVTLKVTDSDGNTSVATAGQDNQPALFVRLYTCGL